MLRDSLNSEKPYQLHSLGRDMLCKLCQEVAGIEHMYVFFEILVVRKHSSSPASKVSTINLPAEPGKGE